MKKHLSDRTKAVLIAVPVTLVIALVIVAVSGSKVDSEVFMILWGATFFVALTIIFPTTNHDAYGEAIRYDTDPGKGAVIAELKNANAKKSKRISNYVPKYDAKEESIRYNTDYGTGAIIAELKNMNDIDKQS